MAIKPSLSDHLSWLEEYSLYEDAWNLLDMNPEAVNSRSDTASNSPTSTPTKARGSLVDFFADDNSQNTVSGQRDQNSHAEKEKRSMHLFGLTVFALTARPERGRSRGREAGRVSEGVRLSRSAHPLFQGT